ncbi:MAG: sialate O-acetylesterase [Planctomycetes bacterium]|nr:sialate O-acetylesterase [Planctomycetota bacterium]
MNRYLLSAVVPWLLLASSLAAQGPLKVFILAGQSNMEGKGAIKHLDALIADTATSQQFAHLKRDGKWVERKDVWISYQRNKGPRLNSGITVGYGSKKNQFGPELGFGHVVGEALKEPVLLIKCAWGGASLKKNFLSPGAGGPGSHYTRMMAETKDVLANVKKYFPYYRGKYEFAGLLWFQGWNDSVGGGNDQYTEQLAQFIRDVRKDLDAPKLPVVIGELGQAGANPNQKVLKFRKQQEAVAKLPEFKGTVRYVKTGVFVDPELPKMFKVWRKCKGKERKAKDPEAKKAAWSEWEPMKAKWQAMASDRPYHYFGSGRTFYLMGDAFGKAMVELLGAPQ